MSNLEDNFNDKSNEDIPSVVSLDDYKDKKARDLYEQSATGNKPQKDLDIKLQEYDEDNVVDFDRLDELSDDEAIVELDKVIDENDKLIERDYLTALAEQNDGKLVYYEVENIYKSPSSNMYKNKLRLRKDPPTLVIKDDYGNEASFKLTENLNNDLSRTLNEVDRAYLGFSGPKKLDVPDNFKDRMKYYVKNDFFKLLLPVIVIGIVMFFVLNKW